MAEAEGKRSPRVGIPGRLGQKVPQRDLHGSRISCIFGLGYVFFVALDDGDHMWYVAMSCRFLPRAGRPLFMSDIVLSQAVPGVSDHINGYRAKINPFLFYSPRRLSNRTLHAEAIKPFLESVLHK